MHRASPCVRCSKEGRDVIEGDSFSSVASHPIVACLSVVLLERSEEALVERLESMSSVRWKGDELDAIRPGKFHCFERLVADVSVNKEYDLFGRRRYEYDIVNGIMFAMRFLLDWIIHTHSRTHARTSTMNNVIFINCSNRTVP